MPQTILPFKLGITSEKITAHGGLALFGEFIHAMNVPLQIDKHLPPPGSPKGYNPSKFVEPLLLMLHGGGRTLEDLRQIRNDLALRDLLKISKQPSSDATGDWLRRMGSGEGLSGLEKVIRLQIFRALNQDSIKDYTLDIDASQIIAEKEEAKSTYKGERGYMPIVGHLAENGIVLGDEFREGNESPGSRNLEFIKHCIFQMPSDKQIGKLRADSAAYQADIFNLCEERNIKFAIGGDLDSAVKKLISTIPEEDWRPFRDGEIAETVHSMNKTKKAFRLIVIRRPSQQSLFDQDNIKLRYTIIGSNREETAEETVKWYNKRGDASENRIKELKIGFGMERMPCGTKDANAVYFRIGVLAYNLFVLFKLLTLPAKWRKHQVQTVRWRLYQIAGKVVKHGGYLYLKISEWMFTLFDEVRTRCREQILV